MFKLGKKVVQLLTLSVLGVGLFILSPLSAQTGPCYTQNSPEYYTAACIAERAELNKIDENNDVLIKRNPVEYLALVFEVFLAIVILVVVFRIVMAGIGIAGAKEDAEKRMEGFKSLLNASIGLIIAISAFVVTVYLAGLLGQDSSTDLIDCNNIPTTIPANSPLLDHCNDATN